MDPFRPDKCDGRNRSEAEMANGKPPLQGRPIGIPVGSRSSLTDLSPTGDAAHAWQDITAAVDGSSPGFTGKLKFELRKAPRSPKACPEYSLQATATAHRLPGGRMR